MRKVLYDRYGGPEVLALRDVPAPTPRRGEVRVRVMAAALNAKDVLVRRGKMRHLVGWRLPRGVGYDWAGVVDAVGPATEGARVGERLFGMLQDHLGGACAEQCIVRVDQCAPMPAGLSFEEGAAVPLAAQTALQALRDVARVGSGARVLIHGASGGVGTFAVQVAKALGAHVTTTSSAANLALCRELGADVTLDYAGEPIPGAGLARLAEGPAFDALFDVFGNVRFTDARAALQPHGTFVSTVPAPHVLAAVLRTVFARRRARLVVVRSRRADLQQLGRWVEEGRLRPVVDRVFDWTEIAAAQAYIETKRARGKVVLRLSSP